MPIMEIKKDAKRIKLTAGERLERDTVCGLSGERCDRCYWWAPLPESKQQNFRFNYNFAEKAWIENRYMPVGNCKMSQKLVWAGDWCAVFKDRNWKAKLKRWVTIWANWRN